MASPLSLKKILLADDDVDDRWFFVDFLKHRTDLEILSSMTNGKELIEYLDGISDDTNFPNLIILDQNMPKLNGKETLSILKNNVRYNKIDIIIYSTYTDQQLVEECMSLGAALVLAKPVSSEGYNHMISDILTATSNHEIKLNITE